MPWRGGGGRGRRRRAIESILRIRRRGEGVYYHRLLERQAHLAVAWRQEEEEEEEFRIVHARGVIPNEVGPARCRATRRRRSSESYTYGAIPDEKEEQAKYRQVTNGCPPPQLFGNF